MKKGRKVAEEPTVILVLPELRIFKDFKSACTKLGIHYGTQQNKGNSPSPGKPVKIEDWEIHRKVIE